MQHEGSILWLVAIHVKSQTANKVSSNLRNISTNKSTFIRQPPVFHLILENIQSHFCLVNYTLDR